MKKQKKKGDSTYGHHIHADPAAGGRLAKNAAHPRVDVGAGPVAPVAAVQGVATDVDGRRGGREAQEQRGEVHVYKVA